MRGKASAQSNLKYVPGIVHNLVYNIAHDKLPMFAPSVPPCTEHHPLWPVEEAFVTQEVTWLGAGDIGQKEEIRK